MTSSLIYANVPCEEAKSYQAELKQYFLEQNTPVFIELFVEEELKIDHAHEIKRRATLSSREQKVCIIAANTFNIFAQNALLKILEEPPEKTLFILFAKHKHVLLPTIRSRLPCIDKRVKPTPKPFGLDLRTCSLDEVYRYLQRIDQENWNKAETQMQISALLEEIKRTHITLKYEKLEYFQEAVYANALYLRPSYNLLPLLLAILETREV
ncbi:DNA polymerase III subunit delta' [Helicobacter suis]|uniref:DNA polymerase III subunit delta' n=1 Tax=Helicobacter suis TaxID=104628 RepID=UPI0015989AE2|nr:DNA polymerase III subunit delta' [Helicobacter suis]BCD49841.1 DNA polymerase III subunit delta' HolB [Helicobacter suis]